MELRAKEQLQICVLWDKKRREQASDIMKQRESKKNSSRIKGTNAKRTLFHVWQRRLETPRGAKQTRPSVCFPRREIRAGGKEGKNSAEETVSEAAADKTADERRSLLNFRSHVRLPLSLPAKCGRRRIRDRFHYILLLILAEEEARTLRTSKREASPKLDWT